jgi:hypothetical protein
MKKIYIGIVLFIAVVLYLYTAQRYEYNRKKEFFIHFDTTNIIGSVEYAEIYSQACMFKIEGIEEEFIFYPYYSELNDNKTFYNLVEKGDSIIKEAYSDVLIVKKDNKVYQYTFSDTVNIFNHYCPIKIQKNNHTGITD